MMRRIILSALSPAERAALLRRSAVPSSAIRRAAIEITESIRNGGDVALAEAGARFGGGRRGGSRIADSEIERAMSAVAPELAEAIRTAATNVRLVHRDQRPADRTVEVLPGVEVERRWTPLRRVGAYVPGGTAPLPSTLVMTVVPAQVAGVSSIAVATPAGADGAIDPVLLATAGLLGVDELHAMGGAQAIAALAYGTETIAAVDKIVGPGNQWVTAAKLAVAGECAIDMPAGPSEALAVVDGSADPRYVAADLLAQAEHGIDSPAVLVTTDPAVADAVIEAAGTLLQTLERAEVIRRALTDHGLVAIARDLEDAFAFADSYAPEHLSIHLAEPASSRAIERITSAGSVYVGSWAPEPVGDYASGANHVLPTGGLACSTSPLSTEDFGSWRQVQRLTESGLRALAPTVTRLATAEGLTAHRAAIEVRFDGGGR